MHDASGYFRETITSSCLNERKEQWFENPDVPNSYLAKILSVKIFLSN